MILRDIDEEIKIAYQIFSTTWLCRWFGFDSAVALSTGKIPVKSANKNTDLQISRLKYIVSKWVLCHKLPWCYRNILLLNIFSSWRQVKSLVNMALSIEIPWDIAETQILRGRVRDPGIEVYGRRWGHIFSFIEQKTTPLVKGRDYLNWICWYYL